MTHYTKRGPFKYIDHKEIEKALSSAKYWKPRLSLMSKELNIPVSTLHDALKTYERKELVRIDITILSMEEKLKREFEESLVHCLTCHSLVEEKDLRESKKSVGGMKDACKHCLGEQLISISVIENPPNPHAIITELSMVRR